MKKLILLLIITCGLGQTSVAQSTHDILIGGAMDVIKTDNTGVFEKVQAGMEGHYFVVRHFAVGLGGEIWSEQKNSFMLGMRWYANDSFFVRLRGLVGVNDASLGAGYSKALSQYWRLEGTGDYYFDASEFAVRVGISYVIR